MDEAGRDNKHMCPELPDNNHLAIITIYLAFLKIFWLWNSSMYSSYKISSSFPETGIWSFIDVTEFVTSSVGWKFKLQSQATYFWFRQREKQYDFSSTRPSRASYFLQCKGELWTSVVNVLPDVDDSSLRFVNYLTLQHQVKNSDRK